MTKKCEHCMSEAVALGEDEPVEPATERLLGQWPVAIVGFRRTCRIAPSIGIALLGFAGSSASVAFSQGSPLPTMSFIYDLPNPAMPMLDSGRGWGSICRRASWCWRCDGIPMNQTVRAFGSMIQISLRTGSTTKTRSRSMRWFPRGSARAGTGPSWRGTTIWRRIRSRARSSLGCPSASGHPFDLTSSRPVV